MNKRTSKEPMHPSIKAYLDSVKKKRKEIAELEERIEEQEAINRLRKGFSSLMNTLDEIDKIREDKEDA